LPSKNHKVEGM